LGLDPFNLKPISVDKNGIVNEPGRYLDRQQEHIDMNRLVMEWATVAYKRHHTRIAPMVCPVPRVPFPHPVCRRCKCPPKRTLAKTGESPIRDLAGFNLTHGLCPSCTKVEDQLLVLKEKDIDVLNNKILRHEREVHEHEAEISRLKEKVKNRKQQLSEGDPGKVPDEEVALTALAYQSSEGCTESAAAKRIGWNRQRLNRWKHRLLDIYDEDKRQWEELNEGTDVSYWSVTLDRVRQARAGICTSPDTA
jgi:hypothetical protein